MGTWMAVAGQPDPAETNVPLDRMLTLISRRPVHNGRKTKLIMSHLGSAVPTPRELPTETHQLFGGEGLRGCGVARGRLPLTCALGPSLSVILCTDERCPRPTEAAVESLPASREILC